LAFATEMNPRSFILPPRMPISPDRECHPQSAANGMPRSLVPHGAGRRRREWRLLQIAAVTKPWPGIAAGNGLFGISHQRRWLCGALMEARAAVRSTALAGRAAAAAPRSPFRALAAVIRHLFAVLDVRPNRRFCFRASWPEPINPELEISAFRCPA